MSKISAEVIADSVCNGHRITTMKVVMPRMILAEFNTHRMFSRNSASSRAIPFKKMVEMVKTNPFIPIKWMKEHSGMQGSEYFEGDGGFGLGWDFRKEWLRARDYAIESATYMSGNGLTKQICNRLLEPFMYHTVLVTATEWENFFALRAHEAAEIHMQALAGEMLTAYNESTPRELKPGEWHIPFETLIGEEEVTEMLENLAEKGPISDDDLTMSRIKVATARCAQTSYTLLGDDDKPLDYAKLITLHDRLATAGHWSPFEHCARAMELREYIHYFKGKFEVNSKYNEFSGQPGGYSSVTIEPTDGDSGKGWCKNFHGFIQYRALFPNENKTDGRVIQHGN